jgi:hypothetical protein
MNGSTLEDGLTPTPPPPLAQKLSFTTLVFLVCLGAFVVTIAKHNYWELLFLALHPTALLYTYHRLQCHTFVPLDSALRVFAAGFLPGALLAASWAHMSTIVLSFVFDQFTVADTEIDTLTPSIATIKAVSNVAPTDTDALTTSIATIKAVSNVVFLLLMSYGTTALVEELFKLGVARSKGVAWCFNVSRMSTTDRIAMTPRVFSLATMILTTSGAAGFAAVENVVYFGLPCQLVGACPVDRPLHVGVPTLLYRTLVPATLHIVCGIITGVQVARRDHTTTNRSLFTVLKVVFPAVLVHGTYDFAVHFFSVWSAMWCIGAASLIVASAVLMYSLKQLRNELRTKSGGLKVVEGARGDIVDIENTRKIGKTGKSTLNIPEALKMTRNTSRTLRRLSLV